MARKSIREGTAINRRAEAMRPRYWITKLLDFGAGVYDPLLRLTLDEDAFTSTLLELARLKSRGKVLDIACGTSSFEESPMTHDKKRRARRLTKEEASGPGRRKRREKDLFGGDGETSGLNQVTV